ncbi:MAG: transporter [Yoonia sp.]|nr:transporter [Yoonia sp.]
MKNFLTVGAALMLTTTAATAGGIDRSGQSIGAIFEDGKYVELSYGYVTPSVSGVFTVPAGPAAGLELGSGNVASSYGSAGFAFKTDVNDKVSLALIADQPFGADVTYDELNYPLAGIASQTIGSSAQVKTASITAVGRYKFNENLSVHFGPRYLTASGHYTAVVSGVPQYSSTYSAGSGAGYVAGAAYERKDIALRVALTYSSAVELNLDGSLGDMNATMPQSVNLDFQSGVAANTLVFGSVRWAEWSEGNITDTIAGDLVTWDQDVLTYTLGVGRKFSDTFSGAISVGYEEAQGGLSSNLSPTDGYTSVSVGGTYTMPNGIELTGGVRYIIAGDATTEGIGAEFADNSAVAIGLKVAYTY